MSTTAPPVAKKRTDWAALKPHMGLIVALWIAEITGSFETSMVIAAMRSLIEDFGDPAKVGWLLTAYAIVGAAVAAVVGRLGDIFGRKKMMVLALAIGAIGSLISAVSTDFGWVLAGRIMQGMTGAILPLSIGLVRENLPRDHVPMGVGLMISGASLGTAAGLVLGGWIADNYSWQGIFWASAGFCLTALVAIVIWTPRSPVRGSVHGVDWLSGILFAPGVMAVLFYVGGLKDHGPVEPLRLSIFAIGALLIALWVRRSLTSADPLLDIRLFRNRNVAVANGVTALVALSSLQITLVFSILLQSPTWTGIGIGVTALLAGLAKLPSNLLSTFAGPLSGWLTGRGGGRMAMIAGGSLAALGWLAIWFVHDSYLQIVIILCVISFGTTILFAVGPTILADAAPPDRTSEVSGMLTVIRGLFMGIGAMMVTQLLASETVSDPSGNGQFPTAGAFDLTIAVILTFAVLATLAALALPRGRATESA